MISGEGNTHPVVNHNISFLFSLSFPSVLSLFVQHRMSQLCMLRLVFSFARYLLVAKLLDLIHFIHSTLNGYRKKQVEWSPFPFKQFQERKLQCLFIVSLFKCLQMTSSEQLRALRYSIVCIVEQTSCVLWDCASLLYCCRQVQKDTLTTCSRVTFLLKVRSL